MPSVLKPGADNSIDSLDGETNLMIPLGWGSIHKASCE